MPRARRFRALCAALFLLSRALPAGDAPFTIASFNIQVFGAAKMARPAAAAVIADIISRASVTAVQEVRAAGIEPVLALTALLPPRFDFVLGWREGRSASRERYLVVYDADAFTVLDADSWDTPDDAFERDPLGVLFASRAGSGFVLINVHVRPSDAAREIAALPEAAAYFSRRWGEDAVVILGDLNADGRYYDEARLADVFPPEEFTVVIPDECDTTVAAGENTYDRIILSRAAAADFTGASGAFRFDEAFDFAALGIEPKAVSDHYPVWAEFSPGAGVSR